MISRYKTKRCGENARRATINRELALAKHASNLSLKVGLKEWGWCKRNPFSMAKMKKENNARDRILVYEDEESLLNVRVKWLKDIVTFALNTGARMAEILELTWNDVDLFRKAVVIYQGKTGRSKTIPLTSTGLEVL
jgi:integrase